jgi:transposase
MTDVDQLRPAPLKRKAVVYASAAPERIAELYAVEKEIRVRSADQWRGVRQDRSPPIINDLEPWLRAKLAQIGQKIKLAEARKHAVDYSSYIV